MTRALRVADGTSISYTAIDGSEPAVVLLHGLAGSSRELLATARAIGGRRVVLIDQRGHGQSTRMPVCLERASFVADVVAVLDREELGAVDLVGHSMGAHTAMLVAADHPERVRRLVLLEGTAAGATARAVRDLSDWLADWPTMFRDEPHAREHLGDGPLAEAMLDDLESVPDGLRPRFDPAVISRIMDTLVPRRWAEWRQVIAPTLAVFAKNGMFSPEERAAFIAANPRATRVDLAEGSHEAHLDSFDEWTGALRRFIDRR